MLSWTIFTKRLNSDDLLRLRQRTPPVTPLASSTVVRCCTIYLGQRQLQELIMDDTCVHPKLCLEVNLALALRLQSRGGVRKPSPSGPGGEESSRPESGWLKNILCQIFENNNCVSTMRIPCLRDLARFEL